MSRMVRTTAALAAGLVLAACASGFTARFDHDEQQDFGNYNSFTFVSDNPMVVGTPGVTVSPLLEQRIMEALTEQLTAKGYRYVDDREQADFGIGFTVGARDKVKITSYPSTFAGYGYRGTWGRPYYGTEVDARQYTEGVLAVDIFDVEGRRPVWHGVATKSISSADRENVRETVDAAVTAILEGFPPSG